MQHKGQSECGFGVGTRDEECGFEHIFPACKPGQVTGCMRDGAFARNALKRGLELETEVGRNPFKLGFIGSTDTHNSIPGATDEQSFQGHHANNDDDTEKRLRGGPRPERPNLLMNPGGLAGVWAEENTRERHLRRAAAQGDLRHQRPAHQGALLRRLRLRARASRRATRASSRPTLPACRWAAI